MTVRKVVNNKAFGGKRTLQRGYGCKIRVIASGTQTDTRKGVIAYSVAATGCYVTIDAAGTGTIFNA